MRFFLILVVTITIGVMLNSTLVSARDTNSDEPSPKQKKEFFKNWAKNNPGLAKEYAEIMKHHPEWLYDVWNDEGKVQYILEHLKIKAGPPLTQDISGARETPPPQAHKSCREPSQIR